jgi:tripartite-type tricarboxylate transporter receptor subunit TctC
LALTDLIAGHVQMMVPDFTTGIPQLKDGKIRALAVLTKDHSSILPDLPTLDETVLPGLDLLAWAGLFGPAGLPQSEVDTLSKAIKKALDSAEVQSRFHGVGIGVFWADAPEFSDYVKAELVKWTTLIKAAGIEPE